MRKTPDLRSCGLRYAGTTTWIFRCGFCGEENPSLTSVLFAGALPPGVQAGPGRGEDRSGNHAGRGPPCSPVARRRTPCRLLQEKDGRGLGGWGDSGRVKEIVGTVRLPFRTTGMLARCGFSRVGPLFRFLGAGLQGRLGIGLEGVGPPGKEGPHPEPATEDRLAGRLGGGVGSFLVKGA